MDSQLTDIEQVPERVSVLLIVEQQLDCLPAFDHRIPQAPHRYGVRQLSLQEPAVPRDDFRATIPGDLDQPVRSIHNGIVGEATVSLSH